MSRYSKVVWKEGLFLKPHHLQQADRYLEKLVAARTSQMGSFLWGVTELTIDTDRLQEGCLELQKVTGVFKDGTPFDCPYSSPLPQEVRVSQENIGKTLYLTLPNAAQNGHDVGAPEDAATRYVLIEEDGVVDNATRARNEETLEIAVPRLELAIRATPPEGYQSIALAQISDVTDNNVITLDPNFPPVGLTISSHGVYKGYLKNVLGAVQEKLRHLAKYASDGSIGGGMQNRDYLMLMALNRTLPQLQHLQSLPVVHPERLYELLIALVGELSSFETQNRQVKDYGRYLHEDAKACFRPIVDDIRRMLARDVGRAVRLELQDRGDNRFIAEVKDPKLLAQAQFIIQVKADLQLTSIQQDFPTNCKVGPGVRIREIIVNNMPGIPVIHTPTPPPQIRFIANHLYFTLDKTTPLWADFSHSPMIGMQISGHWPGLELEMWAIPED